ncbi:MAG: type II toxin-antitoxin system VapC family toxin [Phenylobacterium sp.]|uniref:type II toxin-antitoxin system VapC family toxin n=1 Tax=Phenylobacterium sp. TaxID=1871053 RepID=UPI003BB6915D
MIVVDASAVLAILLEEPEAAAFETLLLENGGGLMSPVNHWEVLVRARNARGDIGYAAAEALLSGLGIEIAEISATHSRSAANAHVRFGKATPAKLNLGDCFAYALAAEQGGGLLFKGDDFPKTDIASALT